MEIKYTQEQVQNILDLLNGINVQGVGNMQRILNIINILNTPFQKQDENNK
jgi:hypothetical protein